MENMHTQSTSKKDIGQALFGGDASFGLLRLSLGLGTNFQDVRKVLQWTKNTALELGNATQNTNEEA